MVATLDPWRTRSLHANAKLRIYEDRTLATEGLAAVVAKKSAATSLVDGTVVTTDMKWLQTDYTVEVGADALQAAGTTGRGITVAVLDTGLTIDPNQNYASRILASVDVRNGGSGPVTGDPYGHGTHITSIAAGGFQNKAGGYFGIAPQANPRHRARLRRRGRRIVWRRDRRSQLDRHQQGQVQHPRGQPVLRRATAIQLLG